MSCGYYIKIIVTIMGIINEKDVLLKKHKIFCISTILAIAPRLSDMLSSTGQWALTSVLHILL